MTGKFGTIVALAAASLLAGAAAAQDSAPPVASIIVIGEGRVQAAPDTFSMNAEVEGRGADQAAAVLQMTALQAAVTDQVTRLEGVTASRFTTGLPSIQPEYAPTCSNRSYGQPNPCPVIGYVAAMTLSLEGQPAERGGDAVSLAAETGAKSARLTGLSLSDEQLMRRQAAQAAFADARRQADDIAAAAGLRIIRVARVQDPEASGAASPAYELDAGYRDVEANYVAATPITLVPGPITIRSRLAVTFEIR